MALLKVGDSVKVRMFRMEGGTAVYPKGHEQYSDQPVVDCTISGVQVCGIPGCYSLRFADTGEHIGLPFYAWAFVPAGRKV